MGLLVAGTHMQFEQKTPAADWCSKYGYPLVVGRLGWLNHIPWELSLQLVLPAGWAAFRPAQYRNLIHGCRHNCCCPGQIPGGQCHIEPVDYMSAGTGIHYHILPADLPRVRGKRILRLLLLGFLLVHRTDETDGSWNRGSPLQACQTFAQFHLRRANLYRY
jgi:hypothetical protein